MYLSLFLPEREKNKKINPKNPVNPVKKMKQEATTHQIIGAAYKVYNTLGFGFLESVYKKAMLIELNKIGINVETEKPLTVYYDENVVGEFFVDLFVENEVIVELKSVRHLVKEHEVQIVNYLNGLRKEIGLLINFGPSGVEVKRKFRNCEEPRSLKKRIRQDQQD